MLILVLSTLLAVVIGLPAAIHCESRQFNAENAAAIRQPRSDGNSENVCTTTKGPYRILDSDKYPDWSVRGFRRLENDQQKGKFTNCDQLIVFGGVLDEDEYRERMLAFLNYEIDQLDGRSSHWMILAIVFMVVAASLAIVSVAALVMLIKARRAAYRPNGGGR